jgi:PAS domain-containing protein
MEAHRQKELVLILARQFASRLATATLLADDRGTLVYFNEPAERILGRSFAEAGELSATEWASLFKTTDLDGAPVALEAMPAGIALLEHQPAHRTILITGLDGVQRRIAITAFPLLEEPDLVRGVIAFFWENIGDGET